MLFDKQTHSRVWAWWEARLRKVDERFPAVSMWATVAILVLVLWLARWLGRKRLKVEILLQDEIPSPRERALEYCYRPRELVLKGYAQYRDRVYGMQTSDGVKVVIPTRFLDSLKSHPSLSFKASIDNDMQVEYTYFGGPPEYVIHAIKADLTASLPAFTPILHRLTRANMPQTIGTYKDWTPVAIHDRILKLVATNNARVFLGPAACADEEWVEASTGYVLAVFDTIRALKAWPPWLRPLVHRFLPEKAAIRKQWAAGRRRVRRCMAERKARIQQGVQQGTQRGTTPEHGPATMLDPKHGPAAVLDPEHGPATMLDHLSSGPNAGLADDLEKQVLFQMTLVAVGTVTTFAAVVQALYDLATHHRAYVALLRAEVDAAALAHTAHTAEGGGLTKAALAAMPRLDSFIKESQRLGAADLSTFQRAATADLTLPDGTFVPRGTKLEVNTYALQHDDACYDDAHTFDGLRFYRQRQAAGHAHKHLYVSVGKGDLSFGYGRHACPGRYLGQVQIKLVLAEFLRQYDVRAVGPEGPKSLAFEALVAPDAEYEILLRSRPN